MSASVKEIAVDASRYKVVEYTSQQGSHIIAAKDNSGLWKVLCLTTAGHAHQFKWSDADLEFDAGGSL